MHDPECMYVAPPEPEPEVELEPVVEIDPSSLNSAEEGAGAGVIIGIVLGVIVALAALAVGGHFGWKRYKLRKSR